jgi:hypothetical protein
LHQFFILKFPSPSTGETFYETCQAFFWKFFQAA